jgi:hypothetical protein
VERIGSIPLKKFQSGKRSELNPVLGQRSLALLDRQPAQALTVNFEQVESAEHGREVRGPGKEQIKDRGARCRCSQWPRSH